MSDKVQILLDTMTEISSILYAKPEERCPRSILRLHNQTFLHAIACEELIGKPRILTEKKFYGRYLHSLVVHAPIQHRIICSRSTNTEQQERHFSTLSSISVATSSRRPGEIITPGIIRMQAEENQQRDSVKEQESRLGKLARCLTPPENTVIPHRVILKYPQAYQAHLERISDFLHCGEGIWWRHILTGVEFFDAPGERQRNDKGPPLHHFRSHTLQSEEQYLRDCWNECLAQQVTIPHHVLKIYDEDGNLQSVQHTGFLEDDDDDSDSIDGAECDPLVNRTLDNGTNDNDQEDEEEEIVVDLQQVGEDLVETVEEDNVEIPGHDRVSLYVSQDTMMTPQIESLAGNESTTPIQNEVIAEKFKLKTTLAKNVSKVLGETCEVRTLDKMRMAMKNNLKSKVGQENYETALTVVQSKVLAKHSSLKRQFQEWEQGFFAEHDCNEPTADDIRADIRAHELYKTLRLCKQFLQHWNITVHL